jgi:hypothetical protein
MVEAATVAVTAAVATLPDAAKFCINISVCSATNSQVTKNSEI